MQCQPHSHPPPHPHPNPHSNPHPVDPHPMGMQCNAGSLPFLSSFLSSLTNQRPTLSS
ncbi:hypothetical protein BO99DRAFT_13936 [Aspergillus violaceofuscus CBS 115571]|uniref:Uncharacterized protein n=1 Tax=Aspergillus violaceofuscus (strain CBS 115571) TaxID=1450538 RepID=A0A2V5GUU0_ASPV1|nr:hypothetical protein BO99DRAFT_13936 [Aspergillus violaceofuscus CBS 115571]